MLVSTEWIELDEYLKLLDGFPSEHSTMYHQAVWLRSISAGFKVEIKSMKTFSQDGALMAITPFMLIKKKSFRLLGSSISGLFTEDLGPVFMDNLSNKERAIVLKSQAKLAFRLGHYIEWNARGNSGELSSWWNELSILGYDYITRPTLILDLSIGEDALWKSFKGRARNMIRKSEKYGVQAKIINPTTEWFISYYEMLEGTFKKQGRKAPHPLSFYLELAQVVEAGKAYCISAEFDKRVIASGIFLIDNKRLLYFSGTANEEGMNLAASSLVQWKAILKAISEGAITYDMNGLGVPSIDKFKRSFGGEEINHHCWIYRTRLFRIVEPIAIWMLSKGLIRVGNS